MKMTRISIVTWLLLGILLSVECHGLSIISLTRARLTEIDKTIRLYAMLHQGKLPDSLDALVEPDDPLLEKECLLDQWGEPIGYVLEGRKYVIWSTGPDKRMGTADDIITGRPESYVESWKAQYAQPVGGQGTNAVQQVNTGAVQPPVNGGTSPSQVKGGGAEKDGAVPPPSRLWLYAAIALCAFVPFLYLLRRKLKTGNE